MRAGFIGLGKLGLPVSVAMVQKGHEVFGYDVDATKRLQYREGRANLYEPDIDGKLQTALNSGLYIVDRVRDAVRLSEIVFVAVPTPSKPDDSFDTGYVIDAVRSIGRELKKFKRRVVVTVISTVLPGTIRRQIAPALSDASGKHVGEDVGLCYNASFIAMGTVIKDFYNPEFVLIGESDPESGLILERFYQPIVPAEVPRLRMTWENAEIVKMAYNTMIGFKIVYANTLMEMCHKLPTGDVDVVSDALSKATVRIVGPKYLRGGMGDGGGCHPRDNLALSRLSERLRLSANPFEFVMKARAAQAEWLADLVADQALPIVIMGARFKPNTNLTDYSASLLVRDILLERGHEPYVYDPIVNPKPPLRKPSVYLVALDEPFARQFNYEKGSVVIDPWRCLDENELDKMGVRYIPVGRHGAWRPIKAPSYPLKPELAYVSR